jgi:hypothetical protein
VGVLDYDKTIISRSLSLGQITGQRLVNLWGVKC